MFSLGSQTTVLYANPEIDGLPFNPKRGSEHKPESEKTIITNQQN